jgi:hypothetical protein
VWDSPGLQDGTSNERQYIKDMKENVKDVALMIYCVSMNEPRFYKADKKAIQTLTKAFGKEVWKHAIVVLTFANKVENPDKDDDSEYFKIQLQNWKKQLKDHFTTIGINTELCASIPLIPAGNWRDLCLPDRENWLSELWIKFYEVMESSSRLGMYRINRKRLRFTGPTTKGSADENIPLPIHLNPEQEKSFWKSTWDAFTSKVKALPKIVIEIGWKILKDIFF